MRFLLVMLITPLCLFASKTKVKQKTSKTQVQQQASSTWEQATMNICKTAVGRAGKKGQFSKKDKTKLQTCLKTVKAEMKICLEKGKKTTLKEHGGSKKSMLKILKAQKQTTICNLDATIHAVEKYY